MASLLPVAILVIIAVSVLEPQYCNAENFLHPLKQRTHFDLMNDDLSEMNGNLRERRRSRREADSENKSIGQIYRSILMNYDKNEVPFVGANKEAEGTRVTVGLYINSMKLNDDDMSLEATFYLRQSWVDPRFKLPPRTQSEGKLRLPHGAWQQIWVPDVFSRNAEEAHVHDVTVENRLAFLNLTTGSVWFVTKVSAKFSCHLNFRSYPMDKQHCTIIIESFGYTTNQVSLAFLENPIEINSDLHMTNHIVTAKHTTDCSQIYTTGKYPCLEFEFSFKRQIGYYILQTYIPSILILLLSWMQFWIQAKDLTCRILVGFLSTLALLLISHQATDDSPEVSYMTALDIWIGICLFFIFASLVESLIVFNNQRASTEAENKAHAEGTHPEKTSKVMQVIWNQEGVGKVDRVSRIVFPAAFFLFNVVYWGCTAF